MKTMMTLAVCLLLPALLAAQDPMPPDQPQTEMKEAMTAKMHHCSACSMDFKTAKELKKHCAKAHGLKHFCAECDMAFKTKAEMMEHKKKMHAKMLRCAPCDMDFKTAKEAKDHFAKVHGMEHYCAHCNMAFKTEAEFSAHKKACGMRKKPAAPASPAP